MMGAALDHGLQLHLLLHPIKLFLRYDGLMEAIIDIGLMPDLSNVDGVSWPPKTVPLFVD